MALYRSYPSSNAPWATTPQTLTCDRSFYNGKVVSVLSGGAENTITLASLPAHFRIQLLVEFYAYASWDNEYSYIYIDGSTTPIYTYGPKVLNNQHDDFCYDNSWADADLFETFN